MFDFESNRDRGSVIIGWILTVIAAVCVALRLYTRAILTRSLGSDDLFILLPGLIQFFEATGDTIDFLNGFGQHEWTLTPQELALFKKYSYINWIIVFLSYFLIRTSVQLFVLRLLPPHKKWQARTIVFVFFLNVAISLFAMISYGLSCTPFRANWADVPNAKCLPQHILDAAQIANGVLSAIIDVVTALVPEFLLYKVQMRRNTKIVLNFIFAMGLVTAALSIGRAATWNPGVAAEDTTYRSVNTGIFSLLEEKFGIIFACGPALRQLFVHYHRTGSIRPSSRQTPPNADFVNMRQKINLRDIFWYRSPPSSNLPVSRTDRIPSAEETGAVKSRLDVMEQQATHAVHPTREHDSNRGIWGWIRRKSRRSSSTKPLRAASKESDATGRTERNPSDKEAGSEPEMPSRSITAQYIAMRFPSNAPTSTSNRSNFSVGEQPESPSFLRMDSTNSEQRQLRTPQPAITQERDVNWPLAQDLALRSGSPSVS